MLDRGKSQPIFTFKIVFYIILKPLCFTAVFFFQFNSVWGYKKKKRFMEQLPSFMRATLCWSKKSL